MVDMVDGGGESTEDGGEAIVVMGSEAGRFGGGDGGGEGLGDEAHVGEVGLDGEDGSLGECHEILLVAVPWRGKTDRCL
jgi:hypothetical protein